MQLCPTVTSTLRGEPCLPSRACKYSSGLTGSAYRACGEAASALHAMALLQVHQAKALRDLHEGGHDLAVLHELRAVTDLALRATKVTAQSLGRAMSTLVVQERHLWLCLTDMKEQEKVQFLNAPVSQTGLFGDAVESCAQQFSLAQKQTEAIKHIMRRRKPAAASTPAAAPQPARRRGRPPVAAPAPTPRQQPSTVRRRGAGHRQDAQPVQAPAKPGGKRKCKRPWDGRPRDGGNCSSGDGDHTTPSPGGGPGGESFVSFCFCSAAGPAASGTQNFNKRAVSSVSGSQEEESGVPCITGSLPSSSLARQWGVAQEHPSCPFMEPGKGSSTQAPATSRHMQAGLLRFLPHEEESGECYTTHPDPAPCHHRPSLHRPGPGPCVPHRCPTTGTSVTPLVPLARSLGAWLALPSPSRWLLRTIRLGYAIQFARRPPKFRGIRFTSVKPADAPVLRAEIAVLLAKDTIEPVPPADMRSGLFSPYFIVPKKGGGLRPILDLRVLNRALHKLPFKMLTQKRIFGCVRPLDWFAAIDLKDAYFHVSNLPRHRPFLRFAFEGQAYQYKVLPFGLSLSPRVFTKVVEAALVPLREQGVRILNYLDDWLILAGRCLHTGTWCSSTSACWAFGSTGKRANSCQRRGSLFSAWSSIWSTKQHASPRNVLSQCWTASRPYQAGRRFHWNSFRGSWGIWLQLRWQSRSVCSIWDRFSTGSMAESRGGRGNAALTGFRLHRPAARPSGRGQIPRSFGQECPWSRYPDMLWYSQMPRPQAGESRTTGTQYQGFGRVPNCIGISIASSC